MNPDEASLEGAQTPETAPDSGNSAESNTAEPKVDEKALFSDDPDKVREQLKLIDEEKPLSRTEKKEQKLKEKLGESYAPPSERALKKELGLTSSDIKRMQEDILKLKEQSENEEISKEERMLAMLEAKQAEKDIEAKHAQYVRELETEFLEASKSDPELEAQGKYYAPLLNNMEHIHDCFRALMDRPDRVLLTKALYSAFDMNDANGVNGWVAFSRLTPEQQTKEIEHFLKSTAMNAQPRVRQVAPRVPADIPQPGSGVPSGGEKGSMNNVEDAWEWYNNMKKRGLA